jgi:peptide-methionine (S)-S-oxide reductase
MMKFTAVLSLLITVSAACAAPMAAEEPRLVPPPLVDQSPRQESSDVATLAGGCFWGVQGLFQRVAGVSSAVSGYAGGEPGVANYNAVSLGTTRHAESVQITFDPRVISYGRLLQIFFSVAHDPTELNRQGPDFGPQYRSTIFAANEEQERIAAAYIAQLNAAKAFKKKIVTTIEPRRPFFRAEDYHQDFLTTHPTYGYIVVNDLPKLEALRHLFPEIYRAAPALVFAGAAGK